MSATTTVEYAFADSLVFFGNTCVDEILINPWLLDGGRVHITPSAKTYVSFGRDASISRCINFDFVFLYSGG